MVIDTSAIVAILCNEIETEQLLHFITIETNRYISAANWLEVNIVINSRFGQEGENELDNFIKEAEIEIVAVSIEQIKIARQAFK